MVVIDNFKKIKLVIALLYQPSENIINFSLFVLVFSGIGLLFMIAAALYFVKENV